MRNTLSGSSMMKGRPASCPADWKSGRGILGAATRVVRICHLFDGEILGLPVEGIGEPQVAGAVAQVLGHLGAGAVAQTQRHARGALAKRGDHLVERIAQKRLGQIDPQRALQRRLLCAEGGQAIGGGNDLGGLGKRLGPFLREHHAAPDALEQRQSQVAFELFDVHRHGRLGVAQPVSGLGVGAAGHDGLEGAQAFDIHSGSPFRRVSRAGRPRRAQVPAYATLIDLVKHILLNHSLYKWVVAPYARANGKTAEGEHPWRQRK